MSFRSILKENVLARGLYFKFLYLKNLFNSAYDKWYIAVFHKQEFELLKELREIVRGLFPQKLNLANPNRYYIGKNVLGYPTMSFLEKDGIPVGWEKGRIEKEGSELMIMQLSVDREINFPHLFDTYKPDMLVDFGTASGGTAVFFYDLASKYTQPKILSIDISGADFNASREFHQKNKSEEKMSFLFGKSSLDCLEEVKNFLAQRQPGQKVMLSFDDNHEYMHTYKELNMFAPLLQSGDVVLMQDTWNQDLFGHEVSPMLAVHRFLKENPSFALDTAVNKSLTLPCNFIYGVFFKK